MCENEILKQELLDALKKLDNNKTPANDEQTKEFYEAFQKDLKKPFLSATKTGRYQISWKKDRSKRHIDNTYLIIIESRL